MRIAPDGAPISSLGIVVAQRQAVIEERILDDAGVNIPPDGNRAPIPGNFDLLHHAIRDLNASTSWASEAKMFPLIVVEDAIRAGERPEDRKRDHENEIFTGHQNSDY
jgi:hypothetical protein